MKLFHLCIKTIYTSRGRQDNLCKDYVIIDTFVDLDMNVWVDNLKVKQMIRLINYTGITTIYYELFFLEA